MWIIGVIIVFVIMFLLGGAITAEAEDNSPGGINNPNGKWIDVFKKPKLHQIVIWVIGFMTLVWLAYMYFTK